MKVVPVRGAYLVLPDEVYVFKDRFCTCRKKDCPHVEAVIEYRKKGGRKAMEDDVYEIYETCPICGEKITPDHNPRCKDLFDNAKVAGWFRRDEGKIWSFYGLPREQWGNASDDNKSR